MGQLFAFLVTVGKRYHLEFSQQQRIGLFRFSAKFYQFFIRAQPPKGISYNNCIMVIIIMLRFIPLLTFYLAKFLT